MMTLTNAIKKLSKSPNSVSIFRKSNMLCGSPTACLRYQGDGAPLQLFRFAMTKGFWKPVGDFVPTLQDFLATDWEVSKPKPKP